MMPLQNKKIPWRIFAGFFQEIAGLLRGLFRDNDGLHNPSIRAPAIGIGEVP